MDHIKQSVNFCLRQELAFTLKDTKHLSALCEQIANILSVRAISTYLYKQILSG